MIENDALSQEHFLATELHYLNITRNWYACVRQCTINKAESGSISTSSCKQNL